MERKFKDVVSTRNGNAHAGENRDNSRISVEEKHLKVGTSENTKATNEITKARKYEIHQLGLSPKSSSRLLNSNGANSRTSRGHCTNRLSSFSTVNRKTCSVCPNTRQGISTGMLYSQQHADLERKLFRLGAKSNNFRPYSKVKRQLEDGEKLPTASLKQEKADLKDYYDKGTLNVSRCNKTSVLLDSKYYLERSKEIQTRNFVSRIPRAQIFCVKKSAVPNELLPTLPCQEELGNGNENADETLGSLPFGKSIEKQQRVIPKNGILGRKPGFYFCNSCGKFTDSAFHSSSCPKKCNVLKEDGNNRVTACQIKIRNLQEKELGSVKMSPCEYFVVLLRSRLAGGNQDVSQHATEECSCDENDSEDELCKAKIQRKMVNLKGVVSELKVFTEKSDEAMSASCSKDEDTGKMAGNDGSDVNSATPRSALTFVDSNACDQASISRPEEGAEIFVTEDGMQPAGADSLASVTDCHCCVDFNRSPDSSNSREENRGSLTSGSYQDVRAASASSSRELFTDGYIERKRKTLQKIILPVKTRTKKKTLTLTPAFVKQFQAHAMNQNDLKSGLVMTKHRSSKWLEKAGLFNGIISKDLADKTFTSASGLKVVMNIHNYIKYLQKIALESQIKLKDLVERLTQCPPTVYKENPKRGKELPMHCENLSYEECLELLMARPLRSTCSMPSFLLK